MESAEDVFKEANPYHPVATNCLGAAARGLELDGTEALPTRKLAKPTKQRGVCEALMRAYIKAAAPRTPSASADAAYRSNPSE